RGPRRGASLTASARSEVLLRPAAPFRDTPTESASVLHSLAPDAAEIRLGATPVARCAQQSAGTGTASSSTRRAVGRSTGRAGSGAPVLKNRCWRLVRDQSWMAAMHPRDLSSFE